MVKKAKIKKKGALFVFVQLDCFCTFCTEKTQFAYTV